MTHFIPVEEVATRLIAVVFLCIVISFNCNLPPYATSKNRIPSGFVRKSRGNGLEESGAGPMPQTTSVPR